MKRLVISAIGLLIAMTMTATGQQGDILVIDGEQWSLLCRPICHDSLVHNRIKSLLPENHSWDTSNWEGYQAAWSIKNDMLVLDSLLVDMYDAQQKQHYVATLRQQELLGAFAGLQHSFVATWLTDTIRAARGKTVRYEHMGFDRNHEHELHLVVHHGRVVSRQPFENRIVVNGFWFGNKGANDFVSIPQERYPDFAGQRVLFTISDMQADDQGHLRDCTVKTILRGVPADDVRLQQIADDFKAGLMKIAPWQVVRINGKLIVGDGKKWTLPYLLKENSLSQESQEVPH